MGLSTLVFVTLVLGLSVEVFGNQASDEALAQGTGHWTRWFNSDWPDATADYETIAHINHYEGTGCDRDGVPCSQAIDMEIRLSHHHLERYPNADVEEIMDCMILEKNATDPKWGYFCVNADQPAIVETKPECAKLCKKNGQYDDYAKPSERKKCDQCADFEVRYFCLYKDYIDDCGDIPNPPPPSSSEETDGAATTKKPAATTTVKTPTTDPSQSHGFQPDDIIIGDITFSELLVHNELYLAGEL